MKNISFLLENIKKIFFKEEEKKKIIKEIIFKKINIQLDLLEINIQGKYIFLKTKAIIKNEIFLQKESLLKEICLSLEENFIDIR